jgi:hypothetical protein
MSASRKTAQWAALSAGIVFVVFGIFVCFRRVEIYYYTSKAGPWAVNITREIAVWTVAAAFVVAALFLFRLSKNLNKSN